VTDIQQASRPEVPEAPFSSLHDAKKRTPGRDRGR
jgi:hypothetical protein